MALDQKRYERKHAEILRDVRPVYVRIGDWFSRPDHATTLFVMGAGSYYFLESAILYADLIVFGFFLYFLWLRGRDRSLPFKLPFGSKHKDTNNRSGKAEGILYLGNVEKSREEVWFSNSDARTHVLYLGTTGAGKTEGLKSMVTNAMCWGSGFVYVDGKADTDLWSSLSSLVRRFGRDDDLLVLNYMTGNSDTKAPSNTMNPFSSGSASYLTNMLVSLMPDAEGDNAMWKERAVSLVGSLMPALTWKRENQDIPMSVSTIRHYLNLNNVIKLSRDEAIPDHIRSGIRGYLDTLPGYVDSAFDDEGREKPAGPNQPMIDTTTCRQQHGYLSMQFTRSLQSLGDDYGYIFDTQAADVEMVDVVLNRRILVVLIPALEKSSDETANLGKIVAATLKGMMGSTLGSTVEGSSSTVIENKPTHSATPFMTVFDEVGYYTAQGMAVMAAQARSLGFCLIYAAQDLPALEKRVKEEARSITANCNIKIFGKLEDPTQTKEFFEKTVGSALVTEVSGFTSEPGAMSRSYFDSHQASVQVRARASYDGLRAFKEGQAVVTFGSRVVDVQIFYSNPGFAKAMRVGRYMALSPPDETILKYAGAITKLRDLMVKKDWTAQKADVAVVTEPEIVALGRTLKLAGRQGRLAPEIGMMSVAGVYIQSNPDALTQREREVSATTGPTTPEAAAAAASQATDSPAAAPSGGPMSFFGKKQGAGEGAPAAAAAAPSETPAAAAGPVTWDTLVSTAAAPEQPLLSEAARAILREAAAKAGKDLLRSKLDGEPSGGESGT